MRLLRVDAAAPAGAALAEAARILRAGGLVAFPTETVYGLGANALDAEAVGRIFAAKGRPSFNPLIAHVVDEAAARRLAAAWPDDAQRLAERFWPGPLTLVLPKRARVPDVVTAGLPTVALRVPAHPVALALLQTVELPLAAPSANRYTELSPTSAEHVRRALDGRVDLILDGGPTDVGIESTVVDVSGAAPRLLRPGQLTRGELEAVLGRPLGAAPEPQDAGAARPSPGMTERHYSPRARLVLLAADDGGELERRAREARAAGQRCGALLFGAPPPAATHVDHAVPMPAAPGAYARMLYDALHRLDELHCEVVLVQTPPDTPEWEGIRDRLARAAR